MDLLKILTDRKISVRSYISAVQDLRSREYNADQYRALYNELTDGKTSITDDEIGAYTCYLVQAIVRANTKGEPLDIPVLVRDSGEEAAKYMKRIYTGDLSFLLAKKNTDESENSSSTSESGNFKKGVKKRIAEDTYLSMYKKNTRDEIIQALVKYGFEEASANSYYYMLARKFGKPESEIGKKVQRGRRKTTKVKKSVRAEEIYRRYWKTVPKTELITILAKEMEISEKDAAGYYYVGRRAVGAQSEELCPNQKKRKG